MRKTTLLLLSTLLIATSAYAGGSIFGGGKHKTSNPNGVYSIGVHICSSLECPDIRIISGSCDGEHMEKRWGVCICDKGYVSINGRCWACPEGQYSDGIHGCTGCAEGTYKVNEADTECTPCPEDSYCVAGKAYACPEHADCSATDFTCTNGYTKTTTECVCGEGKFVDEEGVCQECPENATCDGKKVTCMDGYYNTNNNCTLCPDERAKTCNNEGITTSCIDGYYMGNTQCVPNGKCADGSTPTKKTFYKGECCSIQATMSYCPGDPIPSCTREESCDYDESDCTGEFANTEIGGGHICCLTGKAICSYIAEGYDRTCICVPNDAPNTQYECHNMAVFCHLCDTDEKAVCPSLGTGCICIPKGGDGDCNEDNCKVCDAGEILWCDEPLSSAASPQNDCYCMKRPEVPETQWACNYLRACIMCESGKYAKCAPRGYNEEDEEDDDGVGICVCADSFDKISCDDEICRVLE